MYLIAHIGAHLDYVMAPVARIIRLLVDAGADINSFTTG
jgi:hypothetical protein